MKLDDTTITVLSTAIEIRGVTNAANPHPHVVITQQLDRKAYLAVNKALEACGGAWSRKAKAHVFTVDPTPAIEHALPHVTPTQLDILFRFAGVTPDEIESRGDCADCANADNGHERGYAPPCNSCLRPYHDQFVPATRVVARGPGYHKFTAGDRQAIKRKMVPARKPKR